MNLVDLLDEFNVVIDTAEGLTELRSLILGLAVRGKLVQQESNDEPASELLKKIEAEKERLYEEGEIRKPKDYPTVPEDEIPFEIPNNWVWARNGNLILFQNGYAFKSGRFQESGIGVIRIGDLQNGEVVENSMKYISEDYASEVKDDYLIKQGDMLIAMSGATTGKLAINKSDKTYLLNQRVGKIDPIFINQDFLYRYLNTKIEENLAKSSGSAIPNLSTKQIGELEIPLPPLVEQHRIVKKIESLFAEVDDLEAKLSRQTKLDEKLQLAVNTEVQQAPDAEASQSAWNFITSNFDTLYHTPEAIDNLKKNILNEAVRGRLVSQNPNDEPASELLKKIEPERERYFKEGPHRKPPKRKTINSDEVEFDIPVGWATTRFSSIVNIINGRAYKKDELLDQGTPVLRVGNLFTSNQWYYSDLELDEHKYIDNGDLIYAWSASFGPFIWEGEKVIYHYHIWKLEFYVPDLISKKFLYYLLEEKTAEIKASGHGISMAHMTKGKMEKLVVPLPPLQEQHRIVQRIEELFAICDQFKAQLEQRQAVNEQLVKGLVGEVLEGG